MAGASIFPTSGQANPTMMIMAFALRLADHLKPLLRQEKVRELSAAFQASGHSAGRRVLVTGATGNLGSEVIAELQRKGFRVRGQYRNRIPDDPGVEWRQLDFAARDLRRARGALLRPGKLHGGVWFASHAPGLRRQSTDRRQRTD